jgi:hypothetical protein
MTEYREKHTINNFSLCSPSLRRMKAGTISKNENTKSK